MSVTQNQSTTQTRFLMGNEAIARGIIQSGCAVATAYPGTPSSEVMESLTRWKKELDHPIYLEWSINEKVAFEVGYGASLAGRRSAVIMKMVGLNVASDPLLSAAYLGIRGGLVVVVADDPGPHSSQTEQDSRFFAWFAKVPVYDPGSPSEALSMTLRAFELSEKYQIPVILRPCLRVCHARQNVNIRTPQDIVDVGPFQKNWTKWAATPKFRLVLHGELNEKIAKICSQEADTEPRLICGSTGTSQAIITSGSVSSHVRDIVSSDSQLSDLAVYKVDTPYPANQKSLQEIVDSKDQTLVIEETYPVLELQLINKTKVVGRVSGDVPQQGELTPEVVEELIRKFKGIETAQGFVPAIKARRPSLCAGCPHRPAFFMIKKLFSNTVFTGDIGCYTLGVNLGAVDTCLCMGASVGMASGFAKSLGQNGLNHVVASIGDSTFFHAGVPALINAVHTKANFVLVLMDNNITAMTGGQPTPATHFLADNQPAVPIDMEELIRGCGVKFLEIVDPYNYRALEDVLSRAKAFSHEQRSGVSVVITRRACIRSQSGGFSDARFQVGNNCDRCMTCIRDLECPAISFIKEDKLVRIDPDLCAGCGFCVEVCPSQAIAKWRETK
ncbi:MAG: indolepyruvate ferredoxin oxidoreductase subunit alpha [Deltaproteobacteria bacterium]|nr:indolepyruvate ferredoxin oxidoreductase subunit alpha [Deltaproteobacteria bacterium]